MIFRFVVGAFLFVAACDGVKLESEASVGTTQAALSTDQRDSAGLVFEYPVDDFGSPAEEALIVKRNAPTPGVERDFDIVVAELRASPNFAATASTMGRRSARTPMTRVEPIVESHDGCRTLPSDGERANAQPIADSRDRSLVSFTTRIKALPSNDLLPHADRVAGPSVPTPYSPIK